MSDHIPTSCYHISGHGGLKKAVNHTRSALAEHYCVMRSDFKGYYQSIRFDVLMEIIENHTQHPIQLNLLRKALHRTETRGGNFYDYNEKGLPKGSLLSPLLGAIALIPLDKALGQFKDIFYARYMDDQKILPSKETIRHFHERSTALYEPSSGNRNVSRQNKRSPHRRDISEYQVNEPAPTEDDVQNIFGQLLEFAAQQPNTLATLRRYVRNWASWLKLRLSTLNESDQCVHTLAPRFSSDVTR